MSQTRVQKMFSDPKFLADYSAWLKDPITIEMLKAAEELSQPSSLSRPDPNAALYMHGVYVGFNRMKAFLQGADRVLESTEEAHVEETYGQDRVIQAMFPQIEKAKVRKSRQQAPAA